MARRSNPSPNVARVVDRHGRVRWRFRKGVVDCCLPGEYGSVEFRAAYEAARQGRRPDGKPTHAGDPHGRFGWLIRQYKESGALQRLSPIFRRNLTLELERFRGEHGHRVVTQMKAVHVEKMMARKVAAPAAANKMLKLIRRLIGHAIRLEVMTMDATKGVKPLKTNPDGCHIWTVAEIAKFRRRHASGTEPRLALEQLLFTGASRRDVVRLGRQNVRAKRIAFRRGKTGGDVDLPILPELAAELAPTPAEEMLFLTHGAGRPYQATSFGNWFREQCDAVGLDGCSAHGLRKAGATRLAYTGAAENEIAAFLGHRITNEARIYTKKANRARLADSGMAKLSSLDGAENASNLEAKLENFTRNPMDKKGN